MVNGTIQPGEPIKLGLPHDEERRRTEAQQTRLISPEVLEASLSTMIDRYETVVTEEGYHLTPEIQIRLNEDADTEIVTVFAGYFNKDSYRRVIFHKDPESGQSTEWIVFSSPPDYKIFGGNQQPIEEPFARAEVRTIIDAMKNKYESDVAEKANSFDIKQHLLTEMAGRITSAEASLESLRTQKDLVAEQGGPFTQFKVSINSLWANNGEKSLEDEEISAKTVTEAVAKAANKFRTMNNRSDIQARITVEVAVGDSYWKIPEEVINPLFQAQAKADREAIRIT